MHPTPQSAGAHRRLPLLQLTALLALILAGCGRPHTFHGTPYNPVIPAPEITGTLGNGLPFALSDLRGKAVMLFFGYTACPDICPLALADMKQIQAQLGDDAAETAVLFVSLDPERDTPERLQAYMQAFDPTFYGVAVPADALEALKKEYGVYSQKVVVNPDDSAAGYLIEHTGWVYVIDKQGNLRVIFSSDMPLEDRVDDVRYLAQAR